MSSIEPLKIAFGERFTVSQAQDFYLQLMQALVAEQPIVLGLNEVQRMDTAAIQLLIRFEEEARRLHIPLSWTPLSDKVQQTLLLAGIDSTPFTEH